TRDGTARSFSYDSVDNLVETTAGATGRAYGPGGGLLRAGDGGVAWDGDGCLIGRRRDGAGGAGGAAVRGGGRGGLEEAGAPTGHVVEAVHDAQGRRLYKAVRSSDGELLGESRFLWDRNRLLQEVRKGADGTELIWTYYCEQDAAPVPRLVRGATDWHWIVT